MQSPPLPAGFYQYRVSAQGPVCGNKMTEQNEKKSEKTKDYKKLARIKSIIFMVLAVVILGGIWLNEKKPFAPEPRENVSASFGTLQVQEDGEYSDRDHVALYLHTYGKLPSNYITKTKAKEAGWNAEEGNLREVLPGRSIGGGKFLNEEGLLPEKDGREWKECDIDYTGGQRNGKRIVYSNDGLIYYTDDHYESFTLLYGEEP